MIPSFRHLPISKLRRIVSLLTVAMLGAAVSSFVSAQCINSGFNEYTCTGNVGTTTVTGSTANDMFIIANGVTGNITIVSGGQTTFDTINFSGWLTGVTIDLSNQAALQPIAAGLQIWFQGFSVAQVTGGAGDDTLTGTGGNDFLNGNPGNDTLNGGVGNDMLSGNPGNDTLNGGAGDDWIGGGPGTDGINGDANNDTRSDNPADCTGDTATGIETDLCPVAPGPTPAPALPETPTGDLCITDGTRVALDGSTLLIFSDFRDTTNGMPITHIPLASLIAPTDEQKASGAPVWVGYKDSEFAPGWAAAVYWQNSHYGFVVYKDGGQTVYDDTGAICGWF